MNHIWCVRFYLDGDITLSQPLPPMDGLAIHTGGWGYWESRLCKVSGKPDSRAASVTEFRRQLIPVAENVSNTGLTEITRVVIRRVLFFDQLRRVQSGRNR